MEVQMKGRLPQRSGHFSSGRQARGVTRRSADEKVQISMLCSDSVWSIDVMRQGLAQARRAKSKSHKHVFMGCSVLHFPVFFPSGLYPVRTSPSTW
ncbi:unnamed protein product [Arctogadus glacialis]